MTYKPELPKLKTQLRVCKICNKEYTINTTNQEDNLDSYPTVCLWCQKPEIHEDIAKFAQRLENKVKLSKEK
jgi:hypothetical protein